ARAANLLAEQLAQIEIQAQGRLGLYVIDTSSGATAGYRSDERFPMCSTFKMLLAGQVLSRVDAGQERLDAQVTFDRSALVEYSP
ncbi:MAG: serine hydrolase, partial [Comamonas sp.]